jgi:cystathionine beta-lyase
MESTSAHTARQDAAAPFGEVVGPLDCFTLEELRTRTSVKWSFYPQDVLPAWVAEMDAATVPAVTEVVGQMLAAGDTGYPGAADPAVAVDLLAPVDYRKLPRYQDAYVDFARRHWGVEVNPNSIALMPDVMQGIGHAVALLGLKRIAITTPVYPPFRAFPAASGAQVIEAGMTSEGRLDFDELERVFKDADGFLLCNPHNPSGVAHTREELTRVFELANTHGIRVIVDEIHAPLTSPAAEVERGADPFTPTLSVPGSEGAIVLFSAAKGFNLAGFKSALMVGGADAAQFVAEIPELITHGAGTLSLAAHTAALVYGDDWLEQVRADIDDRRSQFIEGLDRIAPEAWVQPAEATYFAWVDFSRVPGPDGEPLGEDPGAFLLEHAKVAFNPGLSFGAGGEGFVRVNLATSREAIAEILRRIATALGR